MTRPRFISRPDRRRGYVLLLVLFLLAIGAAATAGLCRMSMEKAVRVREAEADLRRRWAVLTCREVLLPRAEALIATSDDAPEVRREIELGGERFTLVFGDEQAKANVNLLYARSGQAGTERAMRTLAQACGSDAVVTLRPIPGRGLKFGTDEADDEDPPAFESLGQVFGRTPADVLLASRGKLPSVAAVVTCWGDGSINCRRASDAAIRAVLSRDLAAGDITRLLEARRKNRESDTGLLLDSLKLSDTKRETVEDLLTDESTVHSLWIITRARGRNGYDLGVSAGAGEAVTFSW